MWHEVTILLQQGQPDMSQKWPGHLWDLFICLEAEVHQQALGARAAIQPVAQVMVQQSWRSPPRTAVLFGSLPAGTRLRYLSKCWPTLPYSRQGCSQAFRGSGPLVGFPDSEKPR